MFRDFDYKGLLEVIDTLVEQKRGSYNDFLNLTIRDLSNIITTVTNRETEKQLREHAHDLKAGQDPHKSPDASYEDVMRVMEINNK